MTVFLRENHHRCGFVDELISCHIQPLTNDSRPTFNSLLSDTHAPYHGHGNEVTLYIHALDKQIEVNSASRPISQYLRPIAYQLAAMRKQIKYSSCCLKEDIRKQIEVEELRVETVCVANACDARFPYEPTNQALAE